MANNNIQAGSVEWYRAELLKDLGKLDRMMACLNGLIPSSSNIKKVGPLDGLSSVTEMISRVSSLGVSINYNRGKIMDKTLFELND